MKDSGARKEEESERSSWRLRQQNRLTIRGRSRDKKSRSVEVSKNSAIISRQQRCSLEELRYFCSNVEIL